MKKNFKKQKDELDLLILSLTDEASAPDAKFQNGLKSKVLSKVSRQSKFNILSLFDFHNVGLSLGVIALFVFFTAAGLLGGVNLFSSRDIETETATLVFSEEKKEEIISNVFRNNPGAAISSAKTISYVGTGAIRDSLTPADSPLVSSDIRGYTFSHVTTQTQPGPAMGLCPVYYPEVSQQVTDIYDFIDFSAGSPVYYFQSTAKNGDGDLMDYHLAVNSRESLNYKGGEYAVRIIFDHGSTGVNKGSEVARDADGTYEKTITEYFGQNIKIQQKIGDRNSYIILSENKVECQKPLLGEEEKTSSIRTTGEGDDLLISRKWIDSSTFEVVREEIFLDSLDEKNLIVEYKLSSRKDNSGFEEVRDIFSFDIDVPVREVVIKNNTIQEDKDAMLDYIETNDFSVLVPVLDTSYFNHGRLGVHFMNNSSYLFDKKFYPEGRLGDLLFDRSTASYRYTQNYIDPDITFSYFLDGIKYTAVDVRYFEKDAGEESIVESAANGVQVVSKEDHKVRIDGREKIGKLYSTETIAVVTSAPDGEKLEMIEGPCSKIDDLSKKCWKNYIFIFEHDGRMIAIHIYSQMDSINLAQALDFRSLDTSTESEKQMVMQMVESRFDKLSETGIIPL